MEAVAYILIGMAATILVICAVANDRHESCYYDDDIKDDDDK